jgi:hypothetical protein
MKLALYTYLLFSVCLFAHAEAPLSKATYRVPVTDVRLEKYATFEIKALNQATDGEALVVSYQLPQELTGVLTEVSFRSEPKTKDDTILKFVGKDGTMECQQEVCTVRLPNLNIDKAKVDAYLRKNTKGLSGFVEFPRRRAVARAFREGDPAGILTYTQNSNYLSTKTP